MNTEGVALEMFSEVDVGLKNCHLGHTWTKIWIRRQILINLRNVQACYIGQTDRIGRWWCQEAHYCKFLEAQRVMYFVLEQRIQYQSELSSLDNTVSLRNMFRHKLGHFQAIKQP